MLECGISYSTVVQVWVAKNSWPPKEHLRYELCLKLVLNFPESLRYDFKVRYGKKQRNLKQDRLNATYMCAGYKGAQSRRVFCLSINDKQKRGSLLACPQWKFKGCIQYAINGCMKGMSLRQN